MDDVGLMVLLFDRYSIIPTFVDKLSGLQCVYRPGSRRARDYFCDNSGIRKRFDQVLKIHFLDYEATRSTVWH